MNPVSFPYHLSYPSLGLQLLLHNRNHIFMTLMRSIVKVDLLSCKSIDFYNVLGVNRFLKYEVRSILKIYPLLRFDISTGWVIHTPLHFRAEHN